MELTTPESRTYYYECSNGRFRLNYYLSFEILESLASANKIKNSALKDFPDGYDLDCTEADFQDFKKAYDYIHPLPAEILCQTFQTIFTSTKKWKKFKGSGWIPADFLENQTKNVATEIMKNIKPTPKSLSSSNLKKKNLKIEKSKSVVRKVKIDSVLKKLKLASIDTSKALDEQFYKQVQMKKSAVSPEEFFSNISKTNLT